VVTIATIKGELPTIVTKLDKKSNVNAAGAQTGKGTEVKFVTNSGHGFQLFEHSPRLHTLSGNTVTPVASSGKGYSTISGRKFNFYSVNWHTPSENTIDGKSFALEAHFTHQLDDASLVAAGLYNRLAIIALLYEKGTDKQCDTTLALFWNQFPAGAANGNTVRTAFAGTQPDFDKMLKAELDKGYYHWMGSMTTPPCTEGVSWNLIKTPKHVCQSQVNKLQSSLSASQKGLNFNNRVAQPLNHRIVTEMLPLIKYDKQESLTQAQWKLAIETGAGLGAIIQKMTKDFLFVAKGMQVVQMTADMNKNVKLFDDNLKALMYGNADKTIYATPTQRVLNQWYDVQFKWVSLRRLLEDNVATIRNAITGATNYPILERVYFENLPTLLSSDEATAMYMDAAKVNNMVVPALRVQIAGRQRMLSQKMSKEATFVGLEVRIEESIGKLSATMALFEDSHYDIVRGVGSIDEMPLLTDMCTLYEMKSVNGKWNVMQPEITKIIDQNGATDIGLGIIASSNLEVYDEMEKALYMYTHTNNVCDPVHSMNAQSWDTIFAELGRQRMLTQQAIGLFFSDCEGCGCCCG
jgi:carbonic anhydrase